MNILIVEDDFSSRKLLTCFLRNHGTCDVAINGIEAVEAVKRSLEDNNPYDLICLDIMMPEMDGFEALRQIRDFEKSRDLWGSDGVKVIMVTAKSMPRDIISAFNAGCEAYIVKPIDRDALFREIENLGLHVEALPKT